MSTYEIYELQCMCGEKFKEPLARGINASRTPEARRLILEGKFHRVKCPGCGTEVTVEKQFFYTDFDRDTFIRVNPRFERHLWKEESALMERNLSLLPDALSEPDARTPRVVFGMDELREKLIAQDANLDDRIVELLKVLVLYEHPFLMQTPRLRLLLDKADYEWLEFVAFFEHDTRSFRVKFPVGIVQTLLTREQELRDWVMRSHPGSNIFELEGDFWINIWRWSSQPSSLSHLRDFAEQVNAGNEIDTTSPEFTFMLDAGNLPRGSHLPFWAKQDLRTLLAYARQRNLDCQDELFEIRFDTFLSDDWTQNDNQDDIPTLWQLFENLPDTNVEGNTFIHELILESSGSGRYSPTTHDIFIGEGMLSKREKFEDIVRHEIGHGVYEKFKDAIQPWLISKFGWQMFESDDDNMDKWIALLGGWGSVTESQKVQVREHLREALGPGKTFSKLSDPQPASDDDPWKQEEFAPRKVFDKTPHEWYRHNNKWHIHEDKAFFFNFYYRGLSVVNVSTLELVRQMPSNYAAMSPFEFFAELYALYYDEDDPLRKNIPADIMSWLDDNVSRQRLDVQPASKSAPPSSFDTIDRPGSEQ